MKIKSLRVWTLLKLLAIGYAVSYNDFAFPIDQSRIHNYTRFKEIKDHCNSFISSASELESDHDMASRLKTELSFFNGDWGQDSHGATLMPFDDNDILALLSFISPWKLVSFEVQNVNSGVPHQPKNTVSISGVLSIGITRNTTRIDEPDLKFHTRPGMSALKVDFEGLYLETEENGGERLLCLLGNSTFPFKKVPRRFADGYITAYFAVEDTENGEPVILPHDHILLLLRYQKTPSLSTIQIHGEMTSLSENHDYDYFDKVQITSHVGIFTDYLLNSSEELVLESFDHNPLQDAIVEDGVNKFNNSEFCKTLKYFENEEYRVMPNLKHNANNGFQYAVGPFFLGKEIQASERNNEDLRVIFHKIICKEEKVSGVLRMYPATIEPHVAASRTGLSTLTLSVKGKWNSSTGLLSMMGCLGPTLLQCDSVVLLYFPKSFSSKQRSVVSASIFNLKNGTNAFLPVFFGIEMLSPGLHDNGWYSSAYLSYNYSKHDLAIRFRERIQEPRLITYIRRSVFRYPSVDDEKDGTFNISNCLSDNLKINTFSSLETFVRVEVLSLGPLFRTNDPHFYQVSKNEVLTISLNLLLTEKPNDESYPHISKLYLEGVYDQGVGKLYLIGCRKVDFDYVDLERGLDCLIEVTIEYSPVNTRWLINPTAMISIRSQRNEKDDYYHFKTIRLHTFMIHDKNHEENVIFRKLFEGYFRVFLLLMYIVHISNQMKNMKKSHESVSYISLVMLGMWVFGYGITLIYNKEILIMSLETQNYTNRPYNIQSYKRYLNNLDYFARLLVLFLMFLMARISQMVLKARKVVREQGKLAPSEKKVFFVCLSGYMSYFLLRIIRDGVQLHRAGITLTLNVYMKVIMQVLWYMVHDLQDYRWIPQIIGFRIWKPRLCDPLLKYFFMGLFVPYFIQFFYEAVRDPVSYPA